MSLYLRQGDNYHKKPTPLRKDKPSAMLFGRIKNGLCLTHGKEAAFLRDQAAPQ